MADFLFINFLRLIDSALGGVIFAVFLGTAGATFGLAFWQLLLVGMGLYWTTHHFEISKL